MITLFILWLICAIIAVIVEKGRNPKAFFGFFVMCAFLSPFLVFCYLFSNDGLKKVDDDELNDDGFKE